MNIIGSLAVALFLFSLPAFADNADDSFQEVVTRYRAANPKPVMPEVARKFKVQAEFLVQEKRLDQAIELYRKALDIVPWWPEGHYNLALVLGETRKYRDAMREMKRYLLLAPDAAEARTGQDKIYQWEIVAEPEAGRTFRDCAGCPEMVEIQQGSFAMGSNNGEPDEKPLHNVTIAKPFAIGKTEVTQQQWHAVMGDNPSYFTDCADTCPVEQVSWDDVQIFIKKLNAKTGKQYRLPSEAEWEYACRAGNQQEYCGNDNADSVAWTNNNSGNFFSKGPHPAATRQANAFGLYDMSGNVWEWVEDTYHDSYEGAPEDGSAWLNGRMRVLRGGSWGYDTKFGRAAARSKFAANYRYFSYGFRLAQTLP
ncbi:MAG TPA: SUMF1/EgtB/PvdO family nonheme iron enzyme [Gallionellaceae bacterium]|nr:SUMF1/EgtB/PvdO family nonheme iron enzyme [Gallionellaceae bacterium]